MTRGYAILAETPSVEDYLRLRAIAGLSPFSPDAARQGLKGGVFSVVARQGAAAVGMGRIIGDGGLFFQVVDIAVDPAHQGRVLGRAIMGRLTRHIEEALPAGAYVSLIADRPADDLYRRFGFTDTAPASIGMARRAGKERR